MTNEKQIFNTEKVIPAYFKLALPVVFSMVITLIYNLADTYFIAKTNDAMLVAGVSVCSPVFTVLMAIGNIFGQGGSSLIARLFVAGYGGFLAVQLIADALSAALAIVLYRLFFDIRINSARWIHE